MVSMVLRQSSPILSRTIGLCRKLDVHALLWACAKSNPFKPAVANVGAQVLTNDHLRERRLPSTQSFPALRERIGYWETALEHDDPHKSLGNLPPSLYRQQLKQTKSTPNSNFQMSH
jgi:hypothetical protein